MEPRLEAFCHQLAKVFVVLRGGGRMITSIWWNGSDRGPSYLWPLYTLWHFAMYTRSLIWQNGFLPLAWSSVPNLANQAQQT